ncbi:MAG: heterodisulfide reductase [Desulfobulbus propionicus]|nr:MAG: heterodisulfide reductase [Desulfobulbus propionicus]
MENTTRVGAVMVVGGGVSGMQAALDLADSGYKVYLVERSGAIGGAMPQLDKTFPTNDCAMCIIAPKLVECGRHPDIEILVLSKILDVEGEAGNFSVQVKKYPRYVDQDKCIACGICTQHCPVEVDDAFNDNLSKRKAIYITYPQAVPLKYQIDQEVCLHVNDPSMCGICQQVCPADAIHFNDQAEKHTFRVGAIILAPGFRPFNPGKNHIWGFGTLPNVITSLQLERLLAATGPTAGTLRRPSDGRLITSAAFIQCVGSRDKTRCHNEYCSSICCMFAIKEAIILKEKQPDAEITIYHNDVRTHGKDFDLLLVKAQTEYGIEFIRAQIYGVQPKDTQGKLLIHYANEQGRQVNREVDLAVLSVGMETPDSALQLAEKIGIQITPDRFAALSPFHPVSSSREGIFTCGAFNGPRDIPNAVIGGSAAAASASELLCEARNQLTQGNQSPHPKRVTDDKIRIGVFICHCGSNIAEVLDVDELAAFSQTLRHVCYVDQNQFACAQDNQLYITRQIKEQQLNRIVIAACSPETHEPLFRKTLRAAGVNEYMVEMANIRNQDAWVHRHEPQKATHKAKDLIRMAVAKVALQEPVFSTSVPVTPAALVVGGGVAGMVAALNLAEQGFTVHLVERSPILGGNALHLLQTWDGEHIPSYVDNLTAQIHAHHNITIYFKATVVAGSGQAGQFTSTIKTATGRKKTIAHGATVLATGGRRYIPKEFEYGKLQNVVTAMEFDKLHMHNEMRVVNGKSFVFIQCVGSRTPERPYCSKHCCTHSIQSAIGLKQENPSRRIYILYREIRTYGQRERIYNQARELGIIFIKYRRTDQPIITEEKNGLVVTTNDHVLHREVEIQADVVILAAATRPSSATQELAQLYKLPLNADGFFQEAHTKLRPVEFNTDGIFVCGLAHFPKPLEESISQALAAAAKAGKLLSQKTITHAAIIAHVDPTACDGCGLCLDVCPYDAITPVFLSKTDDTPKLVAIDGALCKGCGICQGVCPKRGVFVTGYTYYQLLAQVDAALEPNDTPLDGTQLERVHG